MHDARRSPQAVATSWFADYPSASQWISLLLGCAAWDPPARNTNNAEFCDPDVDRWAHTAARLQARDPVAAARLWARADRRITDQAPWVSTVSESTTDVTSRRVSNWQHAPGDFVALDQLRVR
jgi:peptide/nickel transport system substrate-binding protein